MALFPSSKQIALAQSLAVVIPAKVTARQLSKFISDALIKQKRINDERIQRASDSDMLALASSYTLLKKQSWRYHCGPCPMPGCSAATDGFVVDAHHNAWFCRKCDDKGTPIGFLIALHGLTFWDAIAELVGETCTVSIPTEKLRPKPKPTDRVTFLWNQGKWQRRAQRMISESQQRLFGYDRDADEARDYLNGRGIWMLTAQVWRLGQARVPFKTRQGKEEANAIIVPWVGPCGTIKAVQYRLIGGASRRFHSKYGGEKTIYGAHLLAPSMDKLLFIVEGEFNAISIWQEAHDLGFPLDVISIGGEGVSEERLFSLVKLAARYRGCVAWLDRVEVAGKVGNVLEDAMLLKSPGGRDANDGAQSRELAGVIAQIFQRFETATEAAPRPVPTTATEAAPMAEDLLINAGCLVEEFGCDEEMKNIYLEMEDAFMENAYSTLRWLFNRMQAQAATVQAWQQLKNPIEFAELRGQNALFL